MGVDIAAAWDAVVEKIKTDFPDYNVKAGEDQGEEAIATPAILIDLVDLEPDPEKDPTTGEWPCLVHFEARVVLSFKEERARRQVAAAAGAIASNIHNERLGIAWGAAQVLSVQPDEFSPVAGQYRVWLVEWAHAADLGTAETLGDGEAAQHVFAGVAPEIGAANESEYDEVTE